jgi:predicted dehydrogenase
MKIGIIGTSFIVHTFIDAALKHKDVTLHSVYSRSEERAKELAQKYDIKHIYTDMDAFLADPEMEFVYVASPNALHYSQSLLALHANKHVLCEKPFTSTPQELSELMAVAKQKQLFLFEAVTIIHLPNYQKVKELLPLLGDIKLIQCNYSKYSSRYDSYLQGENPNIFNPEMSGGALMDLNIYNLHFVLGLFNKPVQCQYYPNKASNGIDTSGIAILEYPTFMASLAAAKDSNSNSVIQIQGEKGYLNIVGSSLCSSVELHLANGTNETYNLLTEENRLYYEFSDFIEYFQNHDLQGCYKLLEHCLSVMETVTDLRHSAGIYFPVDHK